MVCDPQTVEEVKMALDKMNSVCLLAIENVDGCDDLLALADEVPEGTSDRRWTVGISD